MSFNQSGLGDYHEIGSTEPKKALIQSRFQGMKRQGQQWTAFSFLCPYIVFEPFSKN
jgi:hypothetical protein